MQFHTVFPVLTSLSMINTRDGHLKSFHYSNDSMPFFANKRPSVHVLQAVQRMKARHERGERINVVMDSEEEGEEPSGMLFVEEEWHQVQTVFCCH